MRNNNSTILLQICDEMRSFRDVAVELTRTDLLIIEALQNPKAMARLLAAAAEGSRSVACSVDALGDKIHLLEQRLQRR